MANTYTQIYVHVVFAVHNRETMISASWKERLHFPTCCHRTSRSWCHSLRKKLEVRLRLHEFCLLFAFMFMMQTTTAQVLNSPSTVFVGDLIAHDSLQCEHKRSTRVRRCVLQEYEPEGSGSLNPVRKRSISFDRQGRIVEIIYSDVQYRGYDSTILAYDRFGRLMEAVTYDSTGSMSRKETRTNDFSRHLLITTKWTRNSSDHESVDTTVFDSSGNWIRNIHSYGIVEYVHDNNGRLSKEVEILWGDTTSTYHSYSDNSLQDTALSMRGGRVQSHRITRRDKVGRMIQTVYQEVTDSILFVDERTYGDSGMTQQVRAGNVKVIRRYDARGYLREECTYDESNNVTKRTSNTFDQDGNITLTERIDNREKGSQARTVVRWFYEYY